MNCSTSLFVRCIILILMFTSSSGCLSLPKVETAIHDSPRGLVALRVFHDQNAKASHPITLEPGILQTILSGIYVQEQKAFLERLLSEARTSIRVFTDEDIRFLLPYLQEAFSQATAEEEVVLRLNYNSPGGRKHTTGSVFVQKGNLHVTVNNFQSNISKASLRVRSSYGQFRQKLWSLRYDPGTHLVEKGLQQTTEEGLPSTVVIQLRTLAEFIQKGSLPSERAPTAPTLENNRQADPKNEEEIRQEIKQLRQSIQNQERKLKQLEQRMEP